MNQTTLFRYNFRVMMLNNWLLLAFPIAVSQLTVFWLILTRQFSMELPAASAEMVTPILAAFLGSHLLSAEYRTRVGAILASRPVHIGNIVLTRLMVMLLLVWSLAVLSLWFFRFTMKVFDLIPPFLACIPSTLFLTMLALTFATLFRNSLAGFSVAALYWSLDLVPGAPIQPYLSLRSLTCYYSVEALPIYQTFVLHWWIPKAMLLIGAILLYLYHNRLVFSVGSPHTVRVRARSATAAAAIIAFYLLSGAILKVSYGYANLGSLPGSDLEWFRYEMAPFGPVPVASLFGPSFRSYIGDISNPWHVSGVTDSDMLGDTASHRRALQSSLESDPNSIWAPSELYALAQLSVIGETSTNNRVARYREVVTRYPKSPYVGNALRDIARAYVEGNQPADARSAFEELLQRAPGSRFRSDAYRALYVSDRGAGNMAGALQWAERWSGVAPVQEKFEALMYVAELRKANGDLAGARTAAQESLVAVKAFDNAMQADSLVLTPAQTTGCKELAAKAEREARAMQ